MPDNLNFIILKSFQIDNTTIMDQGFVNLIELGGKARSKAELYKLLTAEGQLYLHPYKIRPVDFIADVIDGEKSV